MDGPDKGELIASGAACVGDLILAVVDAGREETAVTDVILAVAACCEAYIGEIETRMIWTASEP